MLLENLLASNRHLINRLFSRRIYDYSSLLRMNRSFAGRFKVIHCNCYYPSKNLSERILLHAIVGIFSAIDRDNILFGSFFTIYCFNHMGIQSMQLNCLVHGNSNSSLPDFPFVSIITWLRDWVSLAEYMNPFVVVYVGSHVVNCIHIDN